MRSTRLNTFELNLRQSLERAQPEDIVDVLQYVAEQELQLLVIFGVIAAVKMAAKPVNRS